MIGLVGCTSFQPEAAPTNDAGTDGAAESGVIDAGADDAGKPDFEADFEKNDGGGWTPAGDPVPTVSDGGCNGGSQRCIEVTSTKSTSYLSRKLPVAPKVRVVAAMKVVSKGDGGVDLFGIKRNGADEGSWLTRKSGTDSYFLETAQPAAPKNEQSVAADFKDWTPIEIILTRDPQPRIEWKVGTAPAVGLALPDTFESGGIDLEVGIRFTKDVTQKWVVRYDDIRIFVVN